MNTKFITTEKDWQDYRKEVAFRVKCIACGNKVEEGDIATYSAYEDKQIICEDCGGFGG